MDRRQCSVDTYALLQAAIIGNEAGVRRALMAGADVNATDASGRTALTNAITGENWQTIHASDASFMSESRLNVLRTLVSQRDISLFTLNAPRACMSGVSPLGMCAWLNMPEAVQVLLDCSAGRMFVDGMDTLGATPLMYAARDGNVDVVRCLLDHGARPDFRDINHRTAIQYGLRQSETLWLCESSLREARSRDRETAKFRDIKLSTAFDNTLLIQRPPSPDALTTFPLPIFTRHETSTSTNKLIHAIRSSDLTLLNSLVFFPLKSSFQTYQTPVLVNKADSNGWSPIHYCAATERPSTEVLDILYRAGADISLFTTSEHYTPLHCLAQRTHVSTHSLYLFAVHLIRDLQAPLGAKDRHEETCIHIAAERGECIHVLMAFLDCDKSGVVRNMRNSRGLTAFEVAKPRFRPAFEMENSSSRPQSSTSTRTIRPSPFTSLSPLRPSQEFTRDCVAPVPCQTDFDLTCSSQCFLDNLQFVSSELSHHRRSMRLDSIQDVLMKASQASRDIFSHLHAQIDEARKELEDARVTLCRVDAFWRAISHAVKARLPNKLRDDEGLLFELTVARRTTRDSGDSQATAVSDGSAFVAHNLNPVSPKSKPPQEYPSASVREYKDPPTTNGPPRLTIVVPQAVVTGVRTTLLPDWLIPRSGTASPKEPQSAASNITNHGSSSHHARLTVPPQDRRPTSPRLEVLRSMLIGQRKETPPRDSDDERKLWKLQSDVVAKNAGGSGSSRFKTWLKKIVPDYPYPSPELTVGTDEEGYAVGRAERGNLPSQTEKKAEERRCNAMVIPMEPALREQLIALVTASRDLGSIEECITAADHFITTAYRSISRAERIAHRALEVRQKAIEDLHIRFARNSSPLQSAPATAIINPASTELSIYRNCAYSQSSSAASSVYSSSQSSRVSLVSTLTDADDEDTRVLRRLLLRKIEARLDGSFDQIDQVTMWLRIVKEVVRGVKNRAVL